MRRFFAVTGSAAALAAALFVFVSKSFGIIAVIVAFAMAVLGVIGYIKTRQKVLITVVCFFVATPIFFGMFNIYGETKVKPLEKLWGKQCEVVATITEEPSTKDNTGTAYTYYPVKVLSVSDKSLPQNFRARITVPGDARADCGDTIKITVTFEKPDEMFRLSNYSNRFFALGYTPDKNYNVEKGTKQSFIKSAVGLRRTIRSVFIKYLDDDIAGIPIALLTGDKNYISDEFYSDIKMTGMSHALAVSGLHISVIALSIVSVLKAMKLGKRISAAAGLIVVVGMAAIAGFSGSIMRSGLMYFLIFFGDFFVRRADGLNSLGFAAVIMLSINPYNICNISFLLSSFATLGILLFADKLTAMLTLFKIGIKPLNAIYNYYASALAVTLSAQVFILPFSLFYFGYISTISPIVNIVLSPIIYFALLFSLMMLMTVRLQLIFSVCVYFTRIFVTLFGDIITWFASLDYCGFSVSDTMLYFYIAMVCLLLLLALVFRKKRAVKLLCILLSAVAVLPFLYVQNRINYVTVDAVFYKSEKGICMTLKNDRDLVIISNTGNSYALSSVRRYISRYNIKTINALIMPLDDVNTNNAIEARFSKKNIEHTLNAASVKEKRIIKNGTLLLWDLVKVDVIERDGGFDLIIGLGDKTLLFDTLGYSSEQADYIFTSDPVVSYRINGCKPSYIIGEYSDEAISGANYIEKMGCNTAITYSNINVVIKGDRLLGFSRLCT